MATIYSTITKRIRKEINDIVGVRTEITYEDLSKLKYCSAVFKETLRLNPPFQSSFRYSESIFSICGLEIPIDTNIWVN